MSIIAKETRTKIVATVGPACNSPEQLAELIEAGADVFRINTAHGERSDHEQTLASIRAASEMTNRPVATLIDLAGPKIRLGELFEEPTTCHLGTEFRFVRGDEPKSANELTSNYERLIHELSANDRVMLADGTVSMIVVSKEHDTVLCQVTAAGIIRSRQGINLPGAKLSVPAMTPRDLDNAKWAAKAGADFVSLSFVRSPVDIMQLRDLLRANGSSAMVIAKIEKPQALDALDEIVAITDAVMVARGDLGVEIDIAETPIVQKRIIAACHKHQRPVIVATQMLDSMTHASQPTRAEATDVANAIFDGTDACMLSAETAVGDHPRLVVEMMNRIMYVTEQQLRDKPSDDSHNEVAGIHPTSTAVVYGAAQVARRIDAKLVVIASKSGITALVKSKQRDFIPSVGVSNNDATLRRMCLFWGIMPLAGAPVSDQVKLREFIESWGRSTGRLNTGDQIVYVTGNNIISDTHNMMVVDEVK